MIMIVNSPLILMSKALRPGVDGSNALPAPVQLGGSNIGSKAGSSERIRLDELLFQLRVNFLGAHVFRTCKPEKNQSDVWFPDSALRCYMLLG
jgi:hypothetical protein